MVYSLFGAGIVCFLAAAYFSQKESDGDKNYESEVRGGMTLCGIFILLATIMAVKNKKKISTKDGMGIAIVGLAVLSSWYMAYKKHDIYLLGAIITIAILASSQLNFEN